MCQYPTIDADRPPESLLNQTQAPTLCQWQRITQPWQRRSMALGCSLLCKHFINLQSGYEQEWTNLFPPKSKGRSDEGADDVSLKHSLQDDPCWGEHWGAPSVCWLCPLGFTRSSPGHCVLLQSWEAGRGYSCCSPDIFQHKPWNVFDCKLPDGWEWNFWFLLTWTKSNYVKNWSYDNVLSIAGEWRWLNMGLKLCYLCRNWGFCFRAWR